MNNILVESVTYDSLQAILKMSALAIAIFRNMFHILTTSAATYLLINYNFPCEMG